MKTPVELTNVHEASDHQLHVLLRMYVALVSDPETQCYVRMVRLRHLSEKMNFLKCWNFTVVICCTIHENTRLKFHQQFSEDIDVPISLLIYSWVV